MTDLLAVEAGYVLLAAMYYAGVMYPVIWFRRNFRVTITHRRRVHA